MLFRIALILLFVACSVDVHHHCYAITLNATKKFSSYRNHSSSIVPTEAFETAPALIYRNHFPHIHAQFATDQELNTLVNEFQLKIDEQYKADSVNGTPRYLSPESRRLRSTMSSINSVRSMRQQLRLEEIQRKFKKQSEIFKKRMEELKRIHKAPDREEPRLMQQT